MRPGVVVLMVSTASPYAIWLKAAGTSSEVIRIRLSYLNRLAARHPGIPIEQLTLDDLLSFLSRAGWQPETRKSARSAIRSYFRWAELTDRIVKDPSRRLPAVRIPATLPHPTPDRVFAAALLAASPRDQIMVLLAALAGLRRGEIARVHTRDIIDDVIRVRGKGGKIREIPLHPRLLMLLPSEPGWVFPGQVNGHISAGRVGVILKRLLGDGWTGHSLRHRFASRAFAVERDLLAVQQLLGHSRPETTMRYTAVPNSSLRAAVLGAA
jgi:integrase/recombinase XerC